MIIRILQISVLLIAIIAINSVSGLLRADIHKRKGKESLRNGFPYVAANEFSNSLKYDSSDGEARGYLGIAYTSVAERTFDINKKGEFLKKAVYEIKDALKTHEDSIINYNLANTYELSGDIDSAIQEAIKSYNQIPSGEAHEKLIALYKIKGDMLLSQNKKDEALKFYTKFVELKGVNVAKEDITGYEFLRNLIPDNFFVHYNLARLYMEQNLWDKAVIELEYINKKIGISNEDIMGKLIYTYYNLGSRYYNEKKFKEAERYLSNIINTDNVGRFGYTVAAINNLSSMYEQIGDIDKVVEILMKLEEIDTQKGHGYYQIAQFFNRKSNPQKAIEYFEKYLPFRLISDTDIFVKLGNLYERIGDINNAVETLMKLEDIDTQKGQGYYQIGHLFNRKSNPQKAIKYFEKYLPYRPISDTDVFVKLGNLYEQVVDINNAVRIYTELEGINSTRGQGYYYIGILYERKGKWADAIKQFEYIIQLRPKDSEMLLKIANLHEKIGNYKKALEMYKLVVNIDPLREIKLKSVITRLYEKIGERNMVLQLFKKNRKL